MSYTFYLRDGTPTKFSKKAFVQTYEKSYYLLSKDNEFYIPKVSVNSGVAEKNIQSILDNGISDKEDVNRILAWKIGGIDHKKSRNHIEFFDKWKGEKEDGKTIIKARYFKCEESAFKKFCERLSDRAIEIERTFHSGDGGLENALSKIISVIDGEDKDESVPGLGPVYILTILYFITKNESPIFDRFAYTAVKAIYNGVTPDKIWYENPSSKNVKDIIRVIDEYKWYLTQVFGSEKIIREEDRALWVYGHLFNK